MLVSLAHTVRAAAACAALGSLACIARVQTNLPSVPDATVQNTAGVRVSTTLPDRVAGGGVSAGAAPLESAAAPRTLLEDAIVAMRAVAPYKLFAAWLDKFNAGDRARLQIFLMKTWPSAVIDDQMLQRDQTGGYELVELEWSTRTMLVGTLKEKRTNRSTLFTLTLDGADATTIARLLVADAPKP